MFSKINFSKIIGGFSKSLNLVNKAIPIYKQVKPIYSNVRKVVNTMKEVKKIDIDEQINNQKLYERPVNNFKTIDINNERGEFNLDTLTFFN